MANRRGDGDRVLHRHGSTRSPLLLEHRRIGRLSQLLEVAVVLDSLIGEHHSVYAHAENLGGAQQPGRPPGVIACQGEKCERLELAGDCSTATEMLPGADRLAVHLLCLVQRPAAPKSMSQVAACDDFESVIANLPVSV